MQPRPISAKELAFVKAHLQQVNHVTLDPRGPGVMRMHLMPATDTDRDTPYLLLLNGQTLLPVSLSWAILLKNFMDALEVYEGQEIEETQWESLLANAVAATKKVYTFTPKKLILTQLESLLRCCLAVARGEEAELPVEAVSLGEYAPHMTAPHRMDLMLSAMTQNGQWHCNQKCLHCYAAGQPGAETPELDTAAWLQVLDKLRAAGVPQVTFTGGEPTMRDDLVALVEASRWFVTRLNTNGRLLTKELCDALYQASLDSVQVTLYSAEEAVHNALVGAPGFADTVAGIRNAVAAGLNVSVNTPLCSKNADYAATLAFADSLGVRYATCSGLIPTGGAVTDASLATKLTAEELENALRAGLAVATEKGMEIDFTSPGWLPEATLRGLGLSLVPSCGACLSNMAIRPDGMLIPCQSWLSGEPLGDFLHQDWPALWNTPRCAEIRAKSAKMEQLCQLREEG